MKTFEELGVSEEIRRAITELGFESPMPVQEEVIPYLLGNKNDVVALAQTGTGKTAAYGRENCVCRFPTTLTISGNTLADSTLCQYMEAHQYRTKSTR